MPRKLITDHRLDNTEVTRRFHDRAASIDAELDRAFQRIDWDRRKAAEKSLVAWVNAYCLGLLLDDPPPPKGCQVLDEMERALTGHSNYMILMARGSGKSSYVECATAFAMATGLQKFTVIVSANQKASTNMMNDLWRMIAEPDTPFAQDYPGVCLPFQLCNGSIRRRQLYRGLSTELSRNAQQIVFPRLQDGNGEELPTSGSVIAVRGIGSGIRGMKKGTLRPSLVLLDDLQDSETAENPESVEKLLQIIRKDVMNLGGKQRLSILQTATPICPDDLVEQIRADRNWKTTTFPGIISWPKNMDLWDRYFKIYDDELATEAPHDGSLAYYRENRDAMDLGAEVFNPSRYSEKDGHISAIQKLLEQRKAIGPAAFEAEFQMKPVKYSLALDVSPKVVANRLNGSPMGTAPDGFTFTVASTDLNLSYAMTTVVVAFKRDMTACVLDHFVRKVSVDSKLPEAEYAQRVYDELAALGRDLKARGYDLAGWGIDASGAPFDAVTLFAKQSARLCGIPACAMLGRASHVYNGFVRSRLRNEIGRTVLCGDPEEHVKAGAGRKYMFWDSDLYRQLAQKAFLSEVGAPGSCSLFGDDPADHSEYAAQFCNEKLKFVKHGQDGRDRYFWKTAEPHDYLDATAQAFAVAASQGMSGANALPSAPRPVRRRPKIVVV